MITVYYYRQRNGRLEVQRVTFENIQEYNSRVIGFNSIKMRRSVEFDDSTTPPKLIRAGLNLKRVWTEAAKIGGYFSLPDCYTSERGDIRETYSGKLVMQGPIQ